MKKIIFTLIFTVSILCSVSSQNLPVLGTIWKENVKSDGKIFVPKYGLIKKVNFIDNNCLFFAGLDRYSKVVFISTNDEKFKISNIEYIGKSFNNLSGNKKVNFIVGWANYIPVEEGWFAASGFRELTDKSTIEFVFKLWEK
ncbi:hypothetical protein D3C87_1588640 [compost metagenome]